MAASGRYCCKSLKMHATDFSAKRQNKPQSPIDIGSSPSPKSLVSSSLDDVTPYMFIRMSRLQPENLVIDDEKRLLQQYRPKSTVAAMQRRPESEQKPTLRGSRECDDFNPQRKVASPRERSVSCRQILIIANRTHVAKPAIRRGSFARPFKMGQDHNDRGCCEETAIMALQARQSRSYDSVHWAAVLAWTNFSAHALAKW